jgi:hypothetical protein
MKTLMIILTVLLVLATGALLVFVYVVQNVEQPAYESVLLDGDFEVRDYPSLVIAEVRRSGDREQGLRDGFGPLARYIFARERGGGGEPIAMTAPVQQQAIAADEKIAMTAPVTQSPDGENNWVVRFIMPSALNLEALPTPGNDAVQLRQLPARRVVAVRFSGRTDDALIAKQEQRLRDWMAARDLSPLGLPTYAYYNDPFTPGFLRRNEIQLPVERGALPAG